MIYIDTSVVLAEIFAEDRRAPESLWAHPLIASKLLKVESWNRIRARKLTKAQVALAEHILGKVAYIELSEQTLARALQPFPTRVRILDAIHLAGFDFLRQRKIDVSLASFDRQMVAAARKLSFKVLSL